MKQDDKNEICKFSKSNNPAIFVNECMLANKFIECNGLKEDKERCPLWQKK